MKNIENPSISIVIPIYNSEKYLRRCLNSVLDQTYPNWNLILVNDGSTDNSGVICDEYSNTYANISTFHNQNSGPCASRNFGIDKAQGDYIVFIDSDDWIGKNHLMVMINAIRKAGSCFVMQGMTDIWGNRIKKKPMTKGVFDANNSDEFFRCVQLYQHCGPCCKLFKTELLKTILFNDNIIASEDYDVTLRYLDKIEGKIITLDECEYFYNHHEGSVSSRFYNYKIEISGLKVLNSSILKYLNRHSGKNMEKQFNEMLGNYTERVLFSIYSAQSLTFFERIKCLKQVPDKYWSLYDKYAYRNSFFINLIKFLLQYKMFILVDILMLWSVKKR